MNPLQLMKLSEPLSLTTMILVFSVVTEHQIQVSCQTLIQATRALTHALPPFVELQLIYNILLNSIPSSYISATEGSKNNKTSTP